MWSGPRNISTAMMRSFENRPDTIVVDEPFYAVYLAATGEDHPMRDAVLASQADGLAGGRHGFPDRPDRGASVFYQKHMTHHMVAGVGLKWMAACRNVFLIRHPDEVVASYGKRREAISLGAIGVERQAELFDRECDRLGHAPPVLDSADVLDRSARTCWRRCARSLGIAFTDLMLAWPAGKRATDGVWAPAWYDQVERSTGFQPPAEKLAPELSPEQRRVAEAAQPYYDRLAHWRIGGF